MTYNNLVKLANKRKEKEKKSKGRVLAESAGGLILGKKALEHGAERVLGVQRLVHGTSEDAARSILAQGLLSSKGGGEHGSSKGLGGALGNIYAERSKGRVHFFKDTPLHRRLAAMHAAGAEGRTQKSFLEGFLGIAKKRGKRVYGAIPYELLEKDYELDPDYKGYAFRSRKGTGDIAAKYLSDKRMGLSDILKNRTGDLVGYAKRNKGRFALGTGLTGVGGAMVYKSGKNVYNRLKKRDSE